MLTQCPGCQTVFRVTPAVLRAAHGQVRCGRCNMQFDAIEQLLDADEHDIAATQTALKALSQPGTPEPPGDPTDAPAREAVYGGTAVAHEDIVLEGNRIEISGVYPGVDSETHTRTFVEEIDLSQDEWPIPASEPAPSPPAAADTAHIDDIAATLRDSIQEALISVDVKPETASPKSTSTEPRPLSELNPWLSARQRQQAPEELLPPPVVPGRWPWALASVLFGLLLAMQLLHHQRQQLARHPGYGSAITNLYAALGRPLPPQWELNGYGLQQWGMVSDPQAPGTLRVRASVTNNAAFAQPYPLLQITMEDRFGGEVGRRAFQPDEYLGSVTQATRLLAAGESANIDLAIVDPGETAVGFQFDTCLQANDGLRCTHSGGS